jgi:predicted amidohydrolase YtcJ
VKACLTATIAASLLGTTFLALAADPRASVVLLHGKIHTQDATRRVAQAIALSGNTILAVGSDNDVNALIGPGTRIVDLGGRVLLPGIIDAHTHPAATAQTLDLCNLGDKPISSAELRGQVATCLAQRPGDPNRWFEVVAVDPVGLVLTPEDLDTILPGRPLILYGSGGHTVWVNSAALRVAHITAATKDPAGGRIERDANGTPTGVLQDTAQELAQRAMPARDLDLDAALLERAFAAMNARGITSVQDASIDDDSYMPMYKRLYDTHRLKMRVRASYKLTDLHAAAKTLVERAIEFRAKWAIDPDFLRGDAVKIFADGLIEYPAQTAALLEPYLDAAGHTTRIRGPSYFTQENLNHIIAEADAAGFTIHVHAIGDRAVRSALDAFAYSRKLNGPSDNRDQIAHLELVDPADFSRFKALSVIANFQLDWAVSDDFVLNGTIPYIGSRRARYLYPARSLRDAGALIVGGSDWGSSFDAFEAMEHAATRSEGRDKEPLLSEQSISIQDIVDAYTINAAFALKQERTTGSLEQGKRGDFIILDRDIFGIDPFEIHDTKVLATYLDGREIYAAPTQNR